MVPDKKEKKRKAATAVSDAPAKKSKKVEVVAEESAKKAPKSILKRKNKAAPSEDTKEDVSSASLKLNGEPARQVKPRKRAADFLSDDEDADIKEAPVEEKKKTERAVSGGKKAKKDDKASSAALKEQAAKAEKGKNKANGKDKKADEVVEKDDESLSGSESDEDGAEDDQTVALLKGFESSGDEDDSEDEGYDPSQPVPNIPDSKKVKRKLLKKQKKSDGAVEQPGTVYIGRIPHGFYEHQMRAYFSQFGDITRLRLSRNRVTGRSKHYAFIEFASTSVAKIVAETMDNYLMYGHILKCKFVPQEQVHPELWKGADRRFKKTPWNRIEKKRLDAGKTRDKWSKSISQEQKRRNAKVEKLKEVLGYEFDLPKLTHVNELPAKETKEIEAAQPAPEESVKAIEAPPKETGKEKEPDDTPKESKKAKEDKKERKASKTGEQDTPKEGAKKVIAKETTESKAAPANEAEGKTKKAEKPKNKKNRVKA